MIFMAAFLTIFIGFLWSTTGGVGHFTPQASMCSDLNEHASADVEGGVHGGHGGHGMLRYGHYQVSKLVANI